MNDNVSFIRCRVKNPSVYRPIDVRGGLYYQTFRFVGLSSQPDVKSGNEAFFNKSKVQVVVMVAVPVCVVDNKASRIDTQ